MLSHEEESPTKGAQSKEAAAAEAALKLAQAQAALKAAQ